LAAGFTTSAHSFVDFSHGRHPCRDDHRFPSRGDHPDQRYVGILEGCDLAAEDIQFFEKVDCRVVERGAEMPDISAITNGVLSSPIILNNFNHDKISNKF
jgi:hypothetical protein